MSDPNYTSAAEKYWNAGWKGVLPLPYGQKTPPPENRTGYKGLWPTWEDVQGWQTTHSGGNLGLRLPNTVVGLDVDSYADKKGADCLAEAVSLWGELPPTVKSTSRLDGVSGIRLFRVPAGTELKTVVTFPDKGLDGIEVVQYFHRYTVAWPSVHPTTNRTYRWLDHDGNVLSDVPHVGSLPDLPQAWIDGLKRQTAQQTHSTVDVDGVLSSLPEGPMSLQVSARLASAVLKIENAMAGRHDTALVETLALLRLAERGETGVAGALNTLGECFVGAITSDSSRSDDDAWAEWDRIVKGQRGHDLIAESPTLATLQDLLGKKPVSASVLAPVGDFLPSSVPETPSEDIWTLKDEVSSLLKKSMATPLDHETLTGVDAFDEVLMGVQQEEGTTESRTSWSPVDLNAILDGDLSPEEPAILPRSDGKLLMYAGRVNAFVGESESGKSWCLLLACVEQMAASKNVVFLDFEDTPQNVVSRLLALGLDKDTLRRHFSYVGPDTPMGAVEKEELFSLLDNKRPPLIGLDGVNAAMTLIGLKLEDNTESTQFHQWILKPLSSTGATLIIVDHVTKDPAARRGHAIGAQAKRSMIDGAMIGVEVLEPFGRGRLGKLELSVLKDKPGGVRAVAEKRVKTGVQYIATAFIDARVEGKVDMRLVFESSRGSEIEEEDPENKLKMKMWDVCHFMQLEDPQKEGIPQTRIVEGVGGLFKDVREALTALVDQGNVTVRDGKKLYGKVSKLHTLESSVQGPEGQGVRELMGEK